MFDCAGLLELLLNAALGMIYAKDYLRCLHTIISAERMDKAAAEQLQGAEHAACHPPSLYILHIKHCIIKTLCM